MKYLKKHLPTKTQLKQFYNLNSTKDFKVVKIEYVRDRIIMDCKIKPGRTLYKSFYQDVNFVNFTKGTFLIVIERRFFDHVIRNVKQNLDPIKSL